MPFSDFHVLKSELFREKTPSQELGGFCIQPDRVSSNSIKLQFLKRQFLIYNRFRLNEGEKTIEKEAPITY